MSCPYGVIGNVTALGVNSYKNRNVCVDTDENTACTPTNPLIVNPIKQAIG